MYEVLFVILIFISGICIISGIFIGGYKVFKSDNPQDRADQIGKVTGKNAGDINALEKAHDESLKGEK